MMYGAGHEDHDCARRRCSSRRRPTPKGTRARAQRSRQRPCPPWHDGEGRPTTVPPADRQPRARPGRSERRRGARAARRSGPPLMLVDANVLVYAVNTAAPEHARAVAWLEERLNGDRRVGLPWESLLAFVRIVTSPRAVKRPMDPRRRGTPSRLAGVARRLGPAPDRPPRCRPRGPRPSLSTDRESRARRAPRGLGDRPRCRDRLGGHGLRALYRGPLVQSARRLVAPAISEVPSECGRPGRAGSLSAPRTRSRRRPGPSTCWPCRAPCCV